MKVVVGVDVGKANLDVSVSEGSVLRLDSTKVDITSRHYPAGRSERT